MAESRLASGGFAMVNPGASEPPHVPVQEFLQAWHDYFGN
jgi:hypothetical protein